MRKLKDWLSSDFVVVVVIIGLLSALSFFDDRYSLFDYQANPNPMLILSMLIAAYRGLRLAAVSSVVIIILYYVNLYYSIDHSTVLSFYEFQYVKTPILIMVLSLLVGELKQRTLNQQDETAQDLVGKESVLKITRDKNHLLNEEIKALRKKLIFKKDSLNVLMDIDGKFSEMSFKKMAANFKKVLEEHFYVNSLYMKIDIRGGESFYVNEEKSSYVLNSDLIAINKDEDNFYQAINSELMLSEDYQGPLIVSQIQLENYGTLTVGILEIPFLHFSKQNIEAIELITNWFSRHLIRNLEMRHLNQNLDIDPKYQILKRKSFLARLEDNFEQASAFEREISVIVVKIPEIEKTAFETYKKVTCIKLQELMRGMDIIGEGHTESDLWLCYIGNKESANQMISKASEEIYELTDIDNKDKNLEFNVYSPSKEIEYFNFLGDIESNA